MDRPFRWAPPDVGGHALVRERLLGPLAERFTVRVVTVEAGAGFGKTTLLAHAVAENRLRPLGQDVWLSCEPADGSPSLLLRALLVAAGGRAEPDTVPTVELVCEAVWALAPAHVCLLLDDVHRIDPASDGWRSLAALVELLPANGHLVLAGRSLGPLPLQQLVVRRDAVRLDEDDLRLHDAEVATLAAERGVDPAVLDGTAGWPALVELRLATGGTGGDDALFTELLASLTADTRREFAMVVATGGGDAELLNAALGTSGNVAAMATLPLVRTTPDGGVSPHALWRRILATELAADDVRDLRRRAADAYAQRGEHRRAFELLVEAGDWELGLPALFEACLDQVDPPWHDELLRWRTLVPATVADRPEVVYLDAMIERAGDPWSRTGRAAFVEAAARFAEMGDVSRELRATVRHTFSAWVAGDLVALEGFYTRLVEVGLDATPGLAILANLNRATLDDLAGNAAGVLSKITPDLSIEPRLDFYFPMYRALAHLMAGDTRAARREGARSAAMAVAPMPAAGTHLAQLVAAVTAWADGDHEAVDEAGLGDPGPRWSIAERVPSLAVAAIVAAHHGRLTEAEEHLHRAAELVPEVGDRDLLASFLAVARATLLAAGGDEQAACVEIEALLARPGFSPGTAGRALVWFPSVAAVVSPAAAAYLAGLPAGPGRVRMLEAVAGLRAVPAGTSPGPIALLDDARAVLTVLPVVLATELACGAVAARDERGRVVVEELRSIAPAATREALQRVARVGSGPARKGAATLLADIPIPPRQPVRVEVMGPIRLWRGDELVVDRHWRRERVRHLLLLLVDRRAIRRAEAGALLWPDLDADAMSANLRTTLSYLHAILEPERGKGEAPYLLQQDAGILRLADDELLAVDAWQLDDELALAGVAERDGLASTALSHLLRGLGHWRGPYLDDAAGEDWSEPARHRVHGRVSAAAIRASELLVADERGAEAVDTARVAVDADPWSEAAYRALVTAHLERGDRAAAKRAAAACGVMLDDLGVSPDPVTTALFVQVQ